MTGNQAPLQPAAAPAVPMDPIVEQAEFQTEPAAAPPLVYAEPPGAAAPAPGMISLLDDHGQVRPLEEIENEALRFAITHCRGQMSEVARRLRIGRSTLYRKLKDLGLDDSGGGPEIVASG
jgi:DNA-binding NtrC family response regulator